MHLGDVRFGAQIAAAAAAHHLDPRLLAAVAAQETGGPGSSSGRNIVGDGGHGHGLFQIDDRSWSFAKTPAAMDPAQNAQVAAGILASDLQRYGGNVRAALSAYNAGSATATGTRTTWGDGSTLGYADSVLRHYADLDSATREDVVAEHSATTQNVNAMQQLAFEQTIPASSLTPPPGSSSALLTDPAAAALLQLPQPSTQSPFAQPLSYAQLMSANGPAGGKEAASADQAMADLIDAGDPFGTTDEETETTI